MKLEPGYEGAIVQAFLTEYGERNNGRLTRLNDCRVTDSHRDMVERWATYELVPLAKLDAFLMKYDLMLFELEGWAQEKYGRDGFVDPYGDPMELVA